jgi:ABC-type iron transport system FetAB permease component
MFFCLLSFIPLFGMMIGNNISAMSVGISHALDTVQKNQDKCEMLVAYGATPFEVGQLLSYTASITHCRPLS